MIVLDQTNTYGFSNATVKIIDNTYEDMYDTVEAPGVPEFNILVPTVQNAGMTNVLELYQPGDVAGYVRAHGNPNALQYGFGPDIIYGALERGDSNAGVYTINLRGPSATMANVVVMMKYRIEEDVPYTDADGNQYYVDENNQITTTAGGTPITRDVLHVRFETAMIENCKKWTDLFNGMNALYSEEEDDEGYKTIPWWGCMYRGASDWGNNIYFSLTPDRAEYDGNMYYKVNLYDGNTMINTDPLYSWDVDSGYRFNTSYYFETQFNNNFPTMRFMTAEVSEYIVQLFNKYAYTVDEQVNGTLEEDYETKFPAIDPFNVNMYAIVVDSGSVDPEVTNAFQLQGGFDGTETRDELFRMFFAGEILGDIHSVLRYRVNYIPDVNYDDKTKFAIRTLVDRRVRMTTATVMLGGMDGFGSAVIDHMANWWENLPGIRQLAKYQSPMMYNPFTRRTMTYPATYFDTMALYEHFAKWGNFFQPFAGAEARWTGFIEDTMPYPEETPQFLQSLNTNRINVVMKDAKDGAYLADQQMDTQRLSDQTELNNEFIISCMLYDLVNLIHYNHFKFNEAEEVRQFNEAVEDCINEKYVQHSASISATVERVGTTGRSKSVNKITVVVDLKDINKFTDIELYLVDN